MYSSNDRSETFQAEERDCFFRGLSKPDQVSTEPLIPYVLGSFPSGVGLQNEVNTSLPTVIVKLTML